MSAVTILISLSNEVVGSSFFSSFLPSSFLLSSAFSFLGSSFFCSVAAFGSSFWTSAGLDSGAFCSYLGCSVFLSS
jgi:hypothetical protein